MGSGTSFIIAESLAQFGKRSGVMVAMTTIFLPVNKQFTNWKHFDPSVNTRTLTPEQFVTLERALSALHLRNRLQELCPANRLRIRIFNNEPSPNNEDYFTPDLGRSVVLEDCHV
jgi:hypothetical protein